MVFSVALSMVAGVVLMLGARGVGWLFAGRVIMGLALLTAAVLGCGYGFCLVFGLAEVQRMARPAELGGMTAIFQAATYLGFAAPYLLSVLGAYASASALLLAVAALAALTLAVTSWQARRHMPAD